MSLLPILKTKIEFWTKNNRKKKPFLHQKRSLAFKKEGTEQWTKQ